MSRATRRGSIKDNAEWEVLRSPVRVLGHDNNTQEMMLLEGQGDDAVVVEEDRDIIIIEPVDDQSETQQVRPSTHLRSCGPDTADIRRHLAH
jgi:hypothetical protein